MDKVTTPEVSVIVCTYNREKYILRNLESLYNQTMDKSRYEVVIVNNNSPDNTDELCRKFIEKHPDLQTTYVIETNQGHTYARNRGIAESKGKYLAFIDDDAFVKSDYCEEIVKFFEKNPSADVIGGKIIPLYESGKEPDWMSPYLLTLVAALDMGDAPREFRPGKFPIGANMAYRAEVFRKHGIFDVALGRRGSGLEGGDEKDMVFRVRENGGKIYYAPRVVVDHIIPESRVTMAYIKGMGLGVGTSERKRIAKKGAKGILYKIAEEVFKTGATVLLFFYYLLKGQVVKGTTLVRFRLWVIQGLLTG